MLRPPRAPNLPLGAAQYSSQQHVRFADTLRLYFNQLDSVLRHLVQRPWPLHLDPGGTPTASQVLLRRVLPLQTDFGALLVGSYVKALTAATAQADFTLRRNGTTFATVRFAAAATVATFVSTTATTFVAGDELTLVAPGTPDATLAGVYGTLLGYL